MKTRTMLCALGALTVAAGCRNEPTELQPASFAGGEVTERSAGILLTAQPDGWRGWDAIQRAVTPLRVRLRNTSDTPIVIEYSSFEVVAPTGTFAALPPLAMDQEVEVVIGPGAPIIDPVWQDPAFAVAPQYAGYYPGARVYPGYEYGWRGATSARPTPVFAEVELPTHEMLEQMLPEGVLDPGGEIEGVLFFEHVPAGTWGLELQAAFRDPATGAVVTRLSIPLTVEDES